MEALPLINRAGRQRMLTQKLMKLVFIQRYDVPYKGNIDEEIMDSVEAINTTQIMLMNCPDNSPAVSSAISTAQKAWLKFILSFNVGDIDHVVELNGIVLIEMDKLVNELIKQHTKKIKEREQKLNNKTGGQKPTSDFQMKTTVKERK